MLHSIRLLSIRKSYQIISLRASNFLNPIATDTGSHSTLATPSLRYCVLLLSNLRSRGANVSEKDF